MLSGRSVLVTGGTGSFGQVFVANLLRDHDVKRVVVFSRDEMKQFEMSTQARFQDKRVRFFLGDVRDKDRLLRAMENVDVVVHAAALKQVPAAEYNPFEAIKTNILGAQNVIEACLDRGVSRVVALSTDKAAAPINLYGATKLCSDKLFTAANHYKGSRDLRLSVVRYGNVMGSRGSVIPFFLARRHEGVLPITSPQMTRFNITLTDGVALVLRALHEMRGGEIFVPKIPSYRIIDVVEAVAPGIQTQIIGVRPGEKIHEEMITTTDALGTIEFPDHFVICPSMPLWCPDEYAKARGGRRCDEGFSYNSGTNHEWLTIDQIRALIIEHIDADFTWSFPSPRS